MRQNRPVLALSDLSSGSDVAVQLAGAFAQLFDTELHVLPFVDLDDTLTALVRRGSSHPPELMCAGPVVNWSRAWLSSLPAPLLTVHEARRKVFHRAVVLCHPDLIDSGIIEDTGRWSHMLTGIYGHTEVRAPQFDVLLLDGSLQTRSVFEHVRDNPADVIAVHAESILEADSDGALRELIPALLARSATPLLLLNSKLVWRGGGSGARTIQSTAA